MIHAGFRVEGRARRYRLAIDMGQDDAIGIDHPAPAGHRFDNPGLGEAARGPGQGSPSW